MIEVPVPIVRRRAPRLGRMRCAQASMTAGAHPLTGGQPPHDMLPTLAHSCTPSPQPTHPPTN